MFCFKIGYNKYDTGNTYYKYTCTHWLAEVFTSSG